MIDEILPPQVMSVARTDDVTVPDLFPEEEALIERAVLKRRLEFTTARHCARRALARLGLPPAPLLRDERGAPRWPEGTVGSMTHCDGFRAAAVARRSEIATLGIDAEPHGELPDGVREVVTVNGELALLERLAADHPEIHWDRLLFSAKESVYKAWYPVTKRWLDFTEAELTIDVPGRGFTARLLVPGFELPGHGTVKEFDGRWTVRDGLVMTSVVIPAG
ncbi:4'-phosphopantetheinyl transferase superfamily protein [Streptomyces sp. 150FB]|uniref:4'-phosphopantetheinyl transferase family protein n=1 Tax=Streptomyces sp. 150FB TaxID=1576605 RepID=UPI000B0EB81F|nr:4'-phosphopantetheinyl transferase superfamily protein [Streptomyces sp. 150FB]